MTYNEKMRKNLKGNLYGVGFFLLISLFSFVYKLYQLYFAETTLFEINGRLLVGDYIVFILFGFGLLALIVSFLIYLYFDNFDPEAQVKLFTFMGVLFLPYTIILFVIGIMKYLEKSTFKFAFFGSIVLALLISGIGFSSSITRLNEIEPLYMNTYSYVLYYEFTDLDGDLNTFDVTLTATSRGAKLEKLEMEYTVLIDAPDETDRVGEFYRLSAAGASTCMNFPSINEHINITYDCEVTEFTGLYEGLTKDNFVNNLDFYFEYGYFSNDGAWITEEGIGMTILEATYDSNIYDDIDPVDYDHENHMDPEHY